MDMGWVRDGRAPGRQVPSPLSGSTGEQRCPQEGLCPRRASLCALTQLLPPALLLLEEMETAPAGPAPGTPLLQQHSAGLQGVPG